MDSKEAYILAKYIAKGRWLVVFASFLIMSFAGATYVFGVYSEAIKSILEYDQQTLTTLGFFKDLGAYVGIVSGLISELIPSWAVLGIGALMNITGYLMVWLSVTQRIAKPKPWQMYLYICIGANSQTFANTGSLVTCVKNFPQSRGSLLGILKGFVGLSGAFFTQIYHAIYGGNETGVILLVGILPSAVSLLVMFVVRPTKVSTDYKNEQKRLYDFLYIALALAGLLLAMIVAENRVKDFPRFGYHIVAAMIVLFLFSNLGVVVKAEMDNIKLDNMKLQQSGNVDQENWKMNEEQKEIELDDTMEEIKINIVKPSLSSTHDFDGAYSLDKIAEPISMRSRLSRVFQGPARGDDFSIPQALVSVDMVILFVSTTCGIGTTLTAIDNMGQIGKALGYTPVNITTFVSLVSIWNFLGRVISGFLSEYLLHKYGFPRPLIFTIVLLLSCVGHVFIAFALPGSLYVASVVIGLCFGALWPVLFSIISELFGLKYYATLYNFGAVASPLGSYILSVRVAGVLYDKEARNQLLVDFLEAPQTQTKLTCTGKQCFRLSFIIMTLVSLFGALISLILVIRTRKFYTSDIYAKFRAEPQTFQDDRGHDSL